MKIKLCCCCLMLIASASASADQFADLIGNKSVWQSFSWGSIEQSLVMRVAGWAPYSEKAQARRDFKRKRAVLLNRKTFEALLVEEQVPIRGDALIIQSGDLDIDACKTMQIWFEQRYGVPKVVVDATGRHDLIAAGNWIEFVDLRYQWDLGATRATWHCSGLRAKGEEEAGQKGALAGYLALGSITREPELKPLFGLRCSQRLEYPGAARPPKDLDDVTFIVDENRRLVLMPDRFPISEKQSITDASIEFTVVRDTSTIETKINRQTGRIATKMLLSGGRGDAEISGRCEKTAPGERKF